jgi:hypothetical protein
MLYFSLNKGAILIVNFKGLSFNLNSAIVEDAGDTSSPASQARPAFA